jgi:hypothetical protein
MIIPVPLIIAIALEAIVCTRVDEPFDSRLHCNLVGAECPKVFQRFACAENVDVEVDYVLAVESIAEPLFSGI